MNNDKCTTSDFTEAVVLRYYGHKISFVDRSQKRAVFHFDMSYDTKEILDQLRKGEIKLEPRSFYLCQREIKDLLYNV